MKSHLTMTGQSRSRLFAGFTLTELFVIIATITILAIFMLPALARAQAVDYRLTCFENLRQLTLGWLMYAHGNNEGLARTGMMGSLVTNPNDPSIMPGGSNEQWCHGSMDTPAHGRTNLLLLERGLIYPYVRNTKVYKCPADTKRLGGTVAVRNVSINCWFNPIDPWAETPGKVLRKLSDMTTLPPARTWTFLEENTNSINDGTCVVNVGNPSSLTWVDYPASHHDNATPIAFADGHVESKKWSDPNVLTISFSNPRIPGTGPDLQWLSERSTARQ
jgi:prepilin-type processing-associated H-X9-DG protein